MKNQETKNIETTEVVKAKGRKSNPESARQKRLVELEAKRAAGELKKGRPVSGTSKRQARIAELEAKKANGTLKKGRPVNGESERQKRLAKAGTVKKGRPAKVKEVSDLVKLERGEPIIVELNEPVKKVSKKK
jgi:hypothetical protein